LPDDQHTPIHPQSLDPARAPSAHAHAHAHARPRRTPSSPGRARDGPVWQSHTHAAAIKADPSYAIFLKKRQALATGPIFDLHVRFSGNPRRSIESPTTEVDLYRTHDAGAAETQELIRRLTYRIESLQIRGFIALSWGATVEDSTRGVYLGGWRTVEDHMRLGTLDAHQVFVKECEEIFQNFRELTVAHVQFKPHDA